MESSNLPPYLTQVELVKITGYETKSRQCRWLKKERIKFRANARDEPVVGRAYWEHLSGAPAAEAAAQEPNWGAFDLAISTRSGNGRPGQAPLQ
jgi:hypothetical protein